MALCDDLDNIEVPVASTFNWVRAKEFFLAPEITCTPVICSSGTAAMDVAPSADSITWSLTPTNLFSGIKTGTGKNATITAAAGASGQGKITYTFKIPSGESYETFTAEKTFWMVTTGLFLPFVDFIPMPVLIFVMAHNDVKRHPAGDAGIDSWEWRVTGGTVYPMAHNTDMPQFTRPITITSWLKSGRITIVAGQTGRVVDKFVDCYFWYSPNPTTGKQPLLNRIPKKALTKGGMVQQTQV